MPERKLREIFDDGQWKMLQRQFEPWADSESMLRKQGFVFESGGSSVERPSVAGPGCEAVEVGEIDRRILNELRRC